MNRHLVIKTSCFCVMKLRNSPAITRVPCLEAEHFNHNLFDPDLIRGSIEIINQSNSRVSEDMMGFNVFAQLRREHCDIMLVVSNDTVDNTSDAIAGVPLWAIGSCLKHVTD